MSPRRFWPSLVLSLALLLVGQVRALSAAPLLVVGSDTVLVGDTFSLTVAIENAIDLFAYQFDVTYDPAIIQPLIVVEGGFLAGAGPTAFVSGNFAVPGVISLVANSLLGPGLSASGGGTLASLEFRALARGLSALTLTDVLLLGPTDVIDPFNLQAGRVTVTGPLVPEPSSLWLVGLAVAAARRHLRRSRRLREA